MGLVNKMHCTFATSSSPPRLSERKGEASLYHDLRSFFEGVRSGEVEEETDKCKEFRAYGDVCETVSALQDTRSHDGGSLIILMKLEVSQGADLQTTPDSVLCSDRAQGTTVGRILELLAVVAADGDRSLRSSGSDSTTMVLSGLWLR
jgi:hypothetical protein